MILSYTVAFPDFKKYTDKGRLIIEVDISLAIISAKNKLRLHRSTISNN